MRTVKRSGQPTIIVKTAVLVLALFVCSCGYRVVGSTVLPFGSIHIKHVRNETYEPRLEDRLHAALSGEFINQGIKVNSGNSRVELETVITDFTLGAIGAVNETIKEQELVMEADIRLIDRGNVTNFRSVQSPIKITFQSTGSVSDTQARKERAIDKACSEIAKEIVGRIVLLYAK